MAVYKDERTGTWYFQAKKTTRRGFSTKKMALTAERNFLNTPIKNVLTFDELANEYLLNLKIQKERSSYLSCEGHYRNNIKKQIGNKKINNITPRDILNIQQKMLERGCAPGYVNTITTLLKTMFNFALKMDYLEKSPCRSVTKLKMEKNKEKIIFWTPMQFNQVIVYESDFTYQSLFYLLYLTGMRVSEAKALWWEDIDLDNRTITISHHMVYKGFISREKGRKNGGEHTISIPAKLIKILESLKNYDSHIDGFSEQSYIFGVIRALPLNTSQRHLDKCAKLAGVPRLHIHGLRHSHASFLINNGISAFDVAHRLGDTVEVVLQRYAHLFNDAEKKVVNIIDECFQ